MLFQNGLRKPALISAVSEGFSGYQLCFKENQRSNSSDSELIFLLRNFWFFSAVSEKISAKTALIQRWFFVLKIWRFSAVSEKISSVSEKITAETVLIQRWFLALKTSVLSAVQSWIRAVQRFSGKTALKQTWKYSESELISAECFWDVNPVGIGVQLWNYQRPRKLPKNSGFGWRGEILEFPKIVTLTPLS